MTSLAVYGWDDNYVLVDHGDGEITIHDCIRDENIAGWHAGEDYVHSIKEALEFIEQYEGWDGGGDVNVEGVYYDFGGHDYSFKRNLKTEMGFDQTPYEVSKSTKKSQSKSQPTFSEMVQKQRNKNRVQKTIYGEANFGPLYHGFDDLGTAEKWWVITYIQDKLGMNGFEEFIDNVVAYAFEKYESK